MAKLRRDTIKKSDYSILDYGWDDQLEGKRKSDNPYDVNNWKHYEWEKGWDDAKESANTEH